MQNKSEAEVLLNVYKNVRSLTKFFIGNLADIDVNRTFEINGIKMNSAHWIISHLAWSENMLILNCVGNTDAGIPWLNEYEFGSNPSEVKTRLEMAELLQTLDNIHVKATEIIGNLSAEDLESDNHLGYTFGGSKSKRNVIIHAIRHEPMHSGQLTWLIKANGGKTV